MNNTQVAVSALKEKRDKLQGQVDTINAALQLLGGGAAAGKAKAPSGNASSARSEAMRRAWAKRKAAAPVAVVKKAKKTAGASLADVA